MSFMDSIDVDALVERHRETLTRLSRPGGCLGFDAPTATVNQPQWYGSDGPTSARRAARRAILSEWRAQVPGVLCRREAIVLAGPPSLDKRIILRSIVPEAEWGCWRLIDAEWFEDELLRLAIRDGSYESVLKPDEVKALEAGGEPFFPRELTVLVYDESSQLAKQALADAICLGENIVIDTVLCSEPAAMTLADQLEQAGYSVRVVDVEVPEELSGLDGRAAAVMS